MQNTVYALDHYEFIRISGTDSISFLQGQVSCNTELLADGRSLVGALCNLKGRVIADFRLVKAGDDIILQCAAGMADKILVTLRKYAVFSKVELEQLGADPDKTPSALGVMGDSITVALHALQLELPDSTDNVSQNADCCAVRLPGPEIRIELWFSTETAKAAFINSIDLECSTDLGAWSAAEIESGTIHVTPQLSEEYTPQLLNYDISGLIDFKKGCYTGQEIVARMFYRGTAKKRLYLATSSHSIDKNSQLLESGVAAGEDPRESEILSFSNHQSPSLLLAILASESAESGQEYRLSDQPDSEIKLQSLPYEQKPAS